MGVGACGWVAYPEGVKALAQGFNRVLTLGNLKINGSEGKGRGITLVLPKPGTKCLGVRTWTLFFSATSRIHFLRHDYPLFGT